MGECKLQPLQIVASFGIEFVTVDVFLYSTTDDGEMVTNHRKAGDVDFMRCLSVSFDLGGSWEQTSPKGCIPFSSQASEINPPEAVAKLNKSS